MKHTEVMRALHVACLSPGGAAPDDLDSPPPDDELVDFTTAARFQGGTVDDLSRDVLAGKVPLWITATGWRVRLSDVQRLAGSRRRGRRAAATRRERRSHG